MDAVLFDLDGVIIDSAPDIAGAVRETMRHYASRVLTDGEIIPFVGYGAQSMLEKCFQKAGEAAPAEALPFYRQYYCDHAVLGTRLYDNVRHTLAQLKKNEGKKIAVVTSKMDDLSNLILEKLGIMALVDMVVGYDSVLKPKPDPEGILMVLSAFKTMPDRAVMVGDAHTDIEAGQRAGTLTCGIMGGYGDQDLLRASGADMFISDISELLRYVV